MLPTKLDLFKALILQEIFFFARGKHCNNVYHAQRIVVKIQIDIFSGTVNLFYVPCFETPSVCNSKM